MLSLFQRREAERLPAHPRDWGLRVLDRYLVVLNPRKEADRATVSRLLRSIETAMRFELREPMFSSVEQVFEAPIAGLPIQLRAYRELHKHLRIWLLG